jgi:branched-subunit amino acid ABC-type transport system permease component
VLNELVLALGFGLVTASVLALAAVGVTLQFGVTGYVNFAYGSYMALAAYIAWTVNSALGLNFWLAVLASAIFMSIFGLLVSLVLLQPFARRNTPPVYMLIVTLGLWLVLSNVILIIWGPQTQQFVVAGSQAATSIGPFIFTPQQLLIIGVAVAALAAVHLILTRTKLGKAMRAMSDDPALARVTGINTERIAAITWLLTGFLIGIAGATLALRLSSFQPTFGDDYLFVIFAAVILGGIGQPYGTMLGALIIGMATEVSAVIINSAYKTDIAFALLIIMLLVRPQGLIPSRGRQ